MAALERWRLLRHHLQGDVPLARLAVSCGVAERTLRRWRAVYRADGLAALVRRPRSDRGRARLPEPLSHDAVHRRLGHASTEATQLYALLADKVADAEIRAARRRRDRATS
ncbi:Winged helix-turn helix [Nonomuraea solani]|uniref:Winged helix-turn helix n=1 Tax=Nonomuraea solani TaxID=1144553 RepID=A0A1H6EWJ0_9ACTN|nr:helix-turn-helix domain-containing protein [Nonomuraea solani]SEH01295.1 Winged helix-turn helix [Nonomuraea solani]